MAAFMSDRWSVFGFPGLLWAGSSYASSHGLTLASQSLWELSQGFVHPMVFVSQPRPTPGAKAEETGEDLVAKWPSQEELEK